MILNRFIQRHDLCFLERRRLILSQVVRSSSCVEISWQFAHIQSIGYAIYNDFIVLFPSQKNFFGFFGSALLVSGQNNFLRRFLWLCLALQILTRLSDQFKIRAGRDNCRFAWLTQMACWTAESVRYSAARVANIVICIECERPRFCSVIAKLLKFAVTFSERP